MEIIAWIGVHWFDALQTSSIVLGLFTTAHTIRLSAKERKIGNLLILTAAYRDIWSQLFKTPKLYRVLQTEIDLTKEPPTDDEQLFVQFLILHLRASFKARQAGMEFDGDAVRADIRQFFIRPIPYSVWQQSKAYQDIDFVEFVEAAIAAQP